jgi:tight adherence protein C
MDFIAPILGALSVGLAAAAVAVRSDRTVKRLIGSTVPPAATWDPGMTRWLHRLGGTSMGRMMIRGTRPARRVELAGGPFTVEELAGRKIALACGGAIVAILLVPGPGRAMGAVLAVVAGAMLPDALITKRGKRRQRAIELRVPDLVEVLVATAEAGMAPAVALPRSASVLHGPIASELERTAREIDLGVPWRTALEHLVARTDVPSLRRLVTALSRSGRLGGAVRAALRGVAGDLRASRRLRSEELARRAPVKMLFPLVFLILPAFLLLTVGPVVLATLRSLQSGG